MKKNFILFLILIPSFLFSQTKDTTSGLIPKFRIKKNNIELMRLAQVNEYFDKIGRKAALMGHQDGSFEMWVWPWKPLRNFSLLFFLGSSTTPVSSSDILRTISVTPEATTISFSYQSFTVKEIIMVPVDKAGAIILLDVNTVEPLKIIPGFLPVMQPEWPAGVGGQYSYWDDDVKAYVVSESQQRALFLVGSPAGEQMTAPPAHMFADNPLQFKIEVKPEETRDKFIPIVIAGGIGDPVKHQIAHYNDVKKLYADLWQNAEKYYLENYNYYQNVVDSTVQVITPVRKINLAYQWGKVALHNLLVKNPTLGEGLVAGYGLSGGGARPGFAWFFGGDAFINSIALNSIQDFSTVKDALAFAQKWQREENFPIRKKSPDEVNNDIGKMAHELSQSDGLIDWWNDYHYGYNHADTTPWYLKAIGDYYHQTGDIEFIKKSWKSIKQAYQWCLNKDSDHDGLMDLKGAGLGALEFGKYVHIYADAYTSVIWVAGIKEVIEMADAMKDEQLKKQAEEQLKKAENALEEKFWVKDLGYYCYGATEEGKQVEEKTPWPELGMTFGVLNDAHSVECLKNLNDADLCTDWGIRSLSVKSENFDPLNYNYGAVWPFIASFFNTAQFKYHFIPAGYQTLQATVNHVFEYNLGTVPEVFSGLMNQKLSEGYHDQGFSTTGFMEPLTRGLLNLDVDAVHHKINFAPNIPADWDSLSVDNIKVGDDVVDLKILRSKGKLILTAKNSSGNDVEISFAPALGLGTKAESVLLDGGPIHFEDENESQAVIVKTDFKVRNSSSLEINFKPVPEIYILPLKTSRGESNQSLKILSQSFSDGKIHVQVEGLSGRDYQIGVTNPDKISSVDGAEISGDRLKIKIQSGAKDMFVKREITVRTKL